MSTLQRKAPKNSKAELHLLGAFDPEGDCIIRDPYYVSVLQNSLSVLLIYKHFRFFIFI